jgi:lysophospholipase L1-like esterase
MIGSRSNRSTAASGGAWRLLLVVVVLMATLLSGSSFAAAAGARPVDYAALGDSYSSGVGTGVYDRPGQGCLRSSKSYPPMWAEATSPRTFAFLACSGATTRDVLDSQVPPVGRGVDLVTVTMGGNDVGFGTVLRTCTTAADDETCIAAIRASEGVALTVLPVRLARTLTAIRQAAPHAKIVVLGYPRLFELGEACPAGTPNERRRTELNDGADLLVGVIASVSRLHDATFVDVRDDFAGHGVCAATSGQAWINGPSGTADAYHPNIAGYQGYRKALSSITDEAVLAS